MKQLNNSTTQQLFSTAKIIILALVLGLGISYTQANWAPPLASPPTCLAGNPGCDAPLNVGATAQIKTGDLTAGGVTLKKVATPTGYSYYSYISPSETTSGSALTSGALYLTSAFAGFRNLAGNNWRWLVLDNGNTFQAGTATIAGGSPDVGKVLTATDATGASTWQAPVAPTFITPVSIFVAGGPFAYCSNNNVWTTYNASSIIPTNAKMVILEVSLYGGGGGSGEGTIGFNIRKNSASPVYKLGRVSISQTNSSISEQGFFPVSNAQTFDICFYKHGEGNMQNYQEAYIIGYM